MRSRALIAVVVVAISVVLPRSVEAAAARTTWAPASTATIHPGVRTYDGTNYCTTNYVFHDAKNVYIGMAAHCTGGGIGANGCPNPRRLGWPVKIWGASHSGRLVYTSWDAMVKEHRTKGTPCNLANDFALVRIDPIDRGKVNPSVPVWGGPTGLVGSVRAGDVVHAFGNSRFREDIAELSPQIGVCTAAAAGGWEFHSLTLTPSIPGDSGSLVLGPQGAALGVVEGFPELNGLGNRDMFLAPALRYMYRHSRLDGVRLATGTLPFSAVP